MILDNPQNRQLIDFARATGILLVILFHVHYGLVLQLPVEMRPMIAEATPTVFNIAWQALGSEIVFFFSGFLLAYLLIREFLRTGGIDLRAYAVRRLARILPLYYLALALYAVAEQPSLAEIGWSAIFLGTIAGTGNVIPVGWSMEAMMHVYLVLPFLVLFCFWTGRPLLTAGILTLASVFVRVLPVIGSDFTFASLFPDLVSGGGLPKAITDLYLVTWYRLTPFLAGLMLAIILLTQEERARSLMARPGIYWPVLIIALFLLGVSAALPVHDGSGWPYRRWSEATWRAFWLFQRPVFDLGIGLLCVAVLTSPRGIARPFGAVLGLPVWHRIAINIYSIYLFHFPLIIVAAVIVFRSTDGDVLQTANYWHITAVWILAAALSLALAIPLTRWVEQPLNRRLRRLEQR